MTGEEGRRMSLFCSLLLHSLHAFALPFGCVRLHRPYPLLAGLRAGPTISEDTDS